MSKHSETTGSAPEGTTAPRTLRGLRAAADYTGLPLVYIRKAVHEGQLPILKLGENAWFFATSDLDDYVASVRTYMGKPA